MGGSAKKKKTGSSRGGPRKKKKGRQQVGRHFKPSLGRFVDTYDRTGEHARPREKAEPRAAAGSGPRLEAAPQTPGAGPPTVRRLLIGAAALVVALGVIGAFRMGGRSPLVIEYDVLVARKPAIVRIDHGPAQAFASLPVPEHEELVAGAVRSVREAAAAHPDSLIVIDPVSPVISFGSLSASDQRQLSRVHGPQAAEVYESAVARFLDGVLAAAGEARVSVLGLPVEPGAAGIEAARRTNRRYARVIDRLDHLVTAHVFFRTASSVGEQRMVEDAIPEALSRGGGRPIVFRLNLEWRVLVDREAVAAYRRADWNTLAAE